MQFTRCDNCGEEAEEFKRLKENDYDYDLCIPCFGKFTASLEARERAFGKATENNKQE